VSATIHLLNRHEVQNLLYRTAERRRIRHFNDLADAAKAQTAKVEDLASVNTDGASDLLDSQKKAS